MQMTNSLLDPVAGSAQDDPFITLKDAMCNDVSHKRHFDEDDEQVPASSLRRVIRKLYSSRRILQCSSTTEPANANEILAAFTDGMCMPEGHHTPASDAEFDHSALKALLVDCSRDSSVLWDTFYTLEQDV